MHTKALHRAARALESAGLAVLRFNFRGVGRSAGRWSGGSGERDDALAALEMLVARYPGEPLVVGGFSFGAWIGLDIGRSRPEVRALVGIAPALDLYDFGFLEGESRALLLVAGDRDPFCPIDALGAVAARLGPSASLVVLPGAAHLLTTHLGELEVSIRDFTARALARL
jgi:alpha/beta superfamily hydrolase